MMIRRRIEADQALQSFISLGAENALQEPQKKFFFKEYFKYFLEICMLVTFWLVPLISDSPRIY